MLINLYIENIVIVKKLNINFNSGLNIITGETGAGKSILIQSILLACGYRSNTSLIKKGENIATVEAKFYIKNSQEIINLLKQADVEFDDIIKLKRVIKSSGKSYCFINDEPISVNEMNSIGEKLIDMQEQFAQKKILEQSHHIEIFDKYSDNFELIKQLNKKYSQTKEIDAEIEKLKYEYSIESKNKEYVEHCLKELTELNAYDGEEIELQNKKLNIKNNASIVNSYDNIIQKISSESGLKTIAYSIEKHINNLYKYDEENAKKLSVNLNEIINNIELISNTAEELSYQHSNLDTDINTINERIFSINQIAKKHGVLPNEVEKAYNNLLSQNNNINNFEENLTNLEKQYNLVKSEYLEIAKTISKNRISSAEILEKEINKQLTELLLENAEFKIKIETDENNFYTHGIDEINFLISTNGNKNFTPLHKSASGGELSRILLALNICLYQKNPASSILFDEVDLGVGGKTANAIGTKLKLLSTRGQVITITHSPQVAAFGDVNFKISKSGKDGETISNMISLSKQEKVLEIARMLSGDKISEEAMDASKKLVEQNECI